MALWGAASLVSEVYYSVQNTIQQRKKTAILFYRRHASRSESYSNEFAKRTLPDTVYEFCRHNPDTKLSNEDAAVWGLLDAETVRYCRGRRLTIIVKVKLSPSPGNMHPDDPRCIARFEAATMKESALFPIALYSLQLPNDVRDSQYHITGKMWEVFQGCENHPWEVCAEGSKDGRRGAKVPLETMVL